MNRISMLQIIFALIKVLEFTEAFAVRDVFEWNLYKVIKQRISSFNFQATHIHQTKICSLFLLNRF